MWKGKLRRSWSPPWEASRSSRMANAWLARRSSGLRFNRSPNEIVFVCRRTETDETSWANSNYQTGPNQVDRITQPSRQTLSQVRPLAITNRRCRKLTMCSALRVRVQTEEQGTRIGPSRRFKRCKLCGGMRYPFGEHPSRQTESVPPNDFLDV